MSIMGNKDRGNKNIKKEKKEKKKVVVNKPI